MEDGLVDVGCTLRQSATESTKSASRTYRSSSQSPAATLPFRDSTGPAQTAENVRDS
jgi:hypothetical protein